MAAFFRDDAGNSYWRIFFGMPQVLSRLELMSSKIAPHSGCKHHDSSMVSGL
jgi:hypothetical protein